MCSLVFLNKIVVAFSLFFLFLFNNLNSDHKYKKFLKRRQSALRLLSSLMKHIFSWKWTQTPTKWQRQNQTKNNSTMSSSLMSVLIIFFLHWNDTTAVPRLSEATCFLWGEMYPELEIFNISVRLIDSPFPEEIQWQTGTECLKECATPQTHFPHESYNVRDIRNRGSKIYLK